MTRETYKKPLDLYKTLIQLDGNECMCPELDFSEEIETLEKVLTEITFVVDDD